MAIKEAILYELESSRDKWITGESIAQTLGVSRSAIWKGMHVLQEQGYEIDAVTNKGYHLSPSCDRLSAAALAPFLNDPTQCERIQVYPTLESTNLTAKRLALEGAADGTTVLAEEQTAGRGRMGRAFYSPTGRGIYMSVILRPGIPASNAISITQAAAVSICHAIHAVTGDHPQIKWVNDLFLNGKKICGILTEALTDCESGMTDFIILGIGINFYASEFPAPLCRTAGALLCAHRDQCSRSRLAAEILNRILDIAEWAPRRAFLSEYRERSLLLGKEIIVYTHTGDYHAMAVDISDDGGLIVRVGDTLNTLHAGDVQIAEVHS